MPPILPNLSPQRCDTDIGALQEPVVDADGASGGSERRLQHVRALHVRRVTADGSTGVSRNEPPRSLSRTAENGAGESKRGQQSQSIEPSLPTSADERQSERNA